MIVLQCIYFTRFFCFCDFYHLFVFLRFVHTCQILIRLLLRLTVHIKRTVKWANWVETHSVPLTVCFHLHNVKQKRPHFNKTG